MARRASSSRVHPTAAAQWDLKRSRRALPSGDSAITSLASAGACPVTLASTAAARTGTATCCTAAPAGLAGERGGTSSTPRTRTPSTKALGSSQRVSYARRRTTTATGTSWSCSSAAASQSSPDARLTSRPRRPPARLPRARTSASRGHPPSAWSACRITASSTLRMRGATPSAPCRRPLRSAPLSLRSCGAWDPVLRTRSALKFLELCHRSLPAARSCRRRGTRARTRSASRAPSRGSAGPRSYSGAGSIPRTPSATRTSRGTGASFCRAARPAWRPPACRSPTRSTSAERSSTSTAGPSQARKTLSAGWRGTATPRRTRSPRTAPARGTRSEHIAGASMAPRPPAAGCSAPTACFPGPPRPSGLSPTRRHGQPRRP
mmetsp:Transcript_9167/g.22098  ORF Transcript_9167/g.22098 Transcript_9167/m.22098 type:complete len:378 (+) Transcript_9167:3813-4946(+)